MNGRTTSYSWLNPKVMLVNGLLLAGIGWGLANIGNYDNSNLTDSLKKKIGKITESTKESLRSITDRSIAPLDNLENIIGRDITAHPNAENIFAYHLNIKKNALGTHLAMLRVNSYDSVIREEAAKYNLPVALVKGIMTQESRGKHWVTSKAGAYGLMQLMPATAKSYGLSPAYLTDTRINIRGGCILLRELLDRYGNVTTALAQYNCKIVTLEKAMKKHNSKNFWEYRDSLPSQTRVYVPEVLAYTALFGDKEYYASLPTSPIPMKKKITTKELGQVRSDVDGGKVVPSPFLWSTKPPA